MVKKMQLAINLIKLRHSGKYIKKIENAKYNCVAKKLIQDELSQNYKTNCEIGKQGKSMYSYLKDKKRV